MPQATGWALRSLRQKKFEGLAKDNRVARAKMDKSGRITVPRLIQNELLRTAPCLRSLIGAVVQVRLEPMWSRSSWFLRI